MGRCSKCAFKNSYFVFNDRSSALYEIFVEKQPAVISPSCRINAVKTPGRSGYLHVDEGAYESYTKTVECGLQTQKYIDEISVWLKGRGEVIFSGERHRRYDAVVKNQIDFAQVFSYGYRRFLVQFDCQPFKRSVNNFEPEVLTAPGLLYNPGNVFAEPKITVYGTGSMTVSVNGRSFSLASVSDFITVDSRVMEAYRSETEPVNSRMTGDFPFFDVGENLISWTGSVTSVEIEPFWRWI